MSSSAPPPPGLGGGKEAAEDQEDRKPVIPAAGEGESFINIKVTSQTSAEVVFRIKRDARLRRLMDMYCGKHSLDPRAVVFLDGYGKQIRPAQTADEVGLNDGDLIDVHLNQHGGFDRRTSVQ